VQQRSNANKVDNESELGEVLELMRLLWKIDHGLQSTSKRMASTLGVTGPQRLAIRVVGQFPGIVARDLSEILCIHPSTLTGIVQRLEERQILKRIIDPKDKRRSRLHLTGIGQAVNRCRMGTVEAAVRRAMARVKSEELRSGQTLLRLLGEELLAKQ
jgi:MarR family transcriptional regulator, organic hydroperoxide resistance regulator